MWHESCHGGGIIWHRRTWYGWVDGSHHVRRDNVLGWRKDTRASSSATILERCLTGMTCSFARAALGVSGSSVVLMRHAPLWLAGWLAGWTAGRMARCSHRTEPSQQLVTSKGGRRMLLALHLLALPAGTPYTTHTMGRFGGFPHEKDPQHRAPQLSRQAPNQL